MSALIWDTSDATVDITGYEFPGLDVVGGTRVISLTGAVPRGSMREDDVVAPVPTPALANLLDPVTSLLDGITLTASAERPATSGTASISNDLGGDRQTISCGAAGKTESAAGWANSAYTNGSTPLTLAPQIYGALHVPNNDTATLLEFGTAATTPIPTPSPTATASPSIAHLAHASDTRSIVRALENKVRGRRWHRAV
jgi:cell division septation protein DedD